MENDKNFKVTKALIKKDIKETGMTFASEKEQQGFVEAVIILTLNNDKSEDSIVQNADICTRLNSFASNTLQACFENEDFFLQHRNNLHQIQKQFPKGVAFLFELDSYSNKTKDLFYFCLHQFTALEMESRESLLAIMGKDKFVDAVAVKQAAKQGRDDFEQYLHAYLKSVAENNENTAEEYARRKMMQRDAALNAFLRKWTPFSLAEYIKKYIAGQDKAVEIFAQMCYEHVARIANPTTNIKKSNYVMFGPTGCGKTEMAKVVRTVLPVPIEVVDASSITSQGFKGMDKEDVFSQLLQRHGERIMDAIIILDEFDKLCYKRTASGGDDVNRSIQFDLLKMIEGTMMYVRYPAIEATIPIDSTRMTFVCAGAFDGAFTPNIKKAFGFGSVDVDMQEEKTILNCLIDFGMVPELAGRISALIPLKQLDINDLYEILTEKENNCIESIKNLYKCAYHIELTFTKEALLEICRIAYDNQLGARNLQSIVETVCHSILNEQTYLDMSKQGNPVIEMTDEMVRNGYYDISHDKKRYSRMVTVV